jgi:hypothetical protein
LTWQTATTGLEVDGAPYRLIQEVDISPTFGVDATLFAVAGGPRLDIVVGQRSVPGSALFRSTNRGASWERVAVPPAEREAQAADGRRLSGFFGRVALSPRFESDGVALVLDNVPTAGGSCQILRTDDHFRTWTRVYGSMHSSYTSCEVPRFYVAEGAIAVLLRRPEGQFGPYARSVDAGVTWDEINIPSDAGQRSQSIAIAADGTLVAPGTDGIWVFGSHVTSTRGMLACPFEPDERFSALYLAYAHWWDYLGCAAESAREAPIAEWTNGQLASFTEARRQLMVDGEPSSGFALGGAPSNPRRGWNWSRPGFGFWPDRPPDRVVTGTVQLFDGGGFLRFSAASGGIVTYVLAGGEWVEILD